MSSKTNIVNMALSHLKQGLAISNVDTENSEPAKVARVFYDVALETILKKRDWSFARKTAALSYIGADTQGRWGAIFRYPPDCLQIRSSSYPSQPVGYAADYELGADTYGRIIYAIDKTSFFTYTFRNTVTETYPADFCLALSYLLAFLMAPRLTGGDPFKLGPAAYQSYEMMVSQAAVSSYNEESNPNRNAQSEFQRARNS